VPVSALLLPSTPSGLTLGLLANYASIMLAQVATSIMAMVAFCLGTADHAAAVSVPRPRASVCNGYSEVLPSISLFTGNFSLTI
jgi:hypothetical protein